METLRTMWNNPKYSDVTLNINGNQYHLHKAIVGSYFPYWDTYFHTALSTNPIIQERIEFVTALKYAYNFVADVRNTDIYYLCYYLNLFGRRDVVVHTIDKLENTLSDLSKSSIIPNELVAPLLSDCIEVNRTLLNRESKIPPKGVVRIITSRYGKDINTARLIFEYEPIVQYIDVLRSDPDSFLQQYIFKQQVRDFLMRSNN